MKKGFCQMLAILVAMAVMVQGGAAFAASGSLLNFEKSINYSDGEFFDIDTSDWYYQDVISSYQYGLSTGVGDGLFDPEGSVSLAQAITYVARVRSIYQGDTIAEAQQGEAWYQPYVDYASEQGIVGEEMLTGSLDASATRAQVGGLIARALPESEYQTLNAQITGVPDMSADALYYDQVLSLYRSGIVKGTDEYGNYLPAQTITRAETAAILNRVVDPESRLSFTLLIGEMKLSDTSLTLHPGESYQMSAEPKNGVYNGGSAGWATDNEEVVTVSQDGIVTAVGEGRALVWTVDINGEKNSSACNVVVRTSDSMDAEQIAATGGPAVFLLEIYNQNGQKTATGSGFFIDSSGIAVTNYHVIEDAYRAVATLTSGEQYEVELVLGYDENRDVAILKVEGSDFAALELADSDELRNGQKIFCLGSPLGMENSISEGIISNTSREVNGQTYIQISAPISPGSSGGAVLDDACRVIGISTGTLSDGQLTNMAVPSNAIAAVEQGSGITLAELSGIGTGTGYAENDDIPDYGALTGAQQIAKSGPSFYGIMSYAYEYQESQLIEYTQYLTQNGFSVVDQMGDAYSRSYIYQKGQQVLAVSLQLSDNQLWILFNV